MRKIMIVGLGNVGLQFEGTRHNMGFHAIDELAKLQNVFFINRPRYKADVATFYDEDRDLSVTLVKPRTGMNSSGQAVKLLLEADKFDDVCILHDDVSRPLGTFKVKQGTGDGRHHGVKSIIDELGASRSFDRLNIGAGRWRDGENPDPGGNQRLQFVLALLCEDDRQLYWKAVSTATQAALDYAFHGINVAMRMHNNRDLRQ